MMTIYCDKNNVKANNNKRRIKLNGIIHCSSSCLQRNLSINYFSVKIFAKYVSIAK